MRPALTRLSGLLDFEAAARLGSFRLAAAERHKTPSALSQQIKGLEQQLRLSLFVRQAQQVSLTAEGRALAATLQRHFDELQDQIGQLQAAQDPWRLRVSTTHSLAMKWLMPRLQNFTSQHPAVDLRLDGSDGLSRVEAGECDVALRYLRAEAQPLDYREQLVLAYRPGLLPRLAPWKSLLRQPLLHEDDPSHWLRLLQREGIGSTEHLDFSRSLSHGALLVQAAVAGHGIALLPFALAAEDLAQGRLMRHRCAPLESEWGYRLLSNPLRRDSPAVQAFTAWIDTQWRATEAQRRQMP